MRNRFMGAIAGILAMLLLATLPAAAFGQVSIGIAVNTAPPPLPVYAQPAIPAEGYIWAPGYWAWDPNYGDYYWVPGTWVMAPEPGMLWTPGWWGWNDGAYYWHQGYWGPQVGFYGGIDYGFGYPGSGYAGGYWRGNQFYYNRSVNNVTNVTNITNVYNQAAPAPRGGGSHVSYNGGQGGIRAQPTAQQRVAMNAHHAGPTAAQGQQERSAASNREMRASVNQGKPTVAATARPGQFSGKDVVAAIAAGGAVHAVARSAAGRTQQPAAQQRSAEAEQRQRAEQQRSAQAEQRQRAEQPSRIREAQAPPQGREQQSRQQPSRQQPSREEPRGNERRPPPKHEENPQNPHPG